VVQVSGKSAGDFIFAGFGKKRQLAQEFAQQKYRFV
jgi:hypothetical protein